MMIINFAPKEGDNPLPTYYEAVIDLTALQQ